MEKQDDNQIIAQKEEGKVQEKTPTQETKDSEEKPKKEMIKQVGKILNEDGEWVEYVEEVDPERPPIAYDQMGSDALPIDPESEIVDFCM